MFNGSACGRFLAFLAPAALRKLLHRFSAPIFGPKTRRKIFAAATADAPLALRQKS
ncbi:hypothetical protein PTQ35_01170 [Campylobacter sp. 46490-21]|uniref:hypothetical protein n=1 Tax=Campylobacter magnus TaxID=3026462 RepID=UPI00235E293B|nr:hypothetical protein [Campylobacter magnus]MDD0847425.1 hypothetical protein [Campylobacter magnus]